MGTAVEQRRPAGHFARRFTAALLVLTLAGYVALPAAAQPLGVENIRPEGALDPCLFVPRVVFGPPSQTIELGASATLTWSVQARGGCPHSLSMIVLARPQINLSPGAPQDWAIWTSSTGVAAQPEGSLQVQPAFNSVYMLVVAWGPDSFMYSAPIQIAVKLPLANRNCLNASTLATNAPTERPAARGAPGRPCRNRVTLDANNLAPLLVQALGTPNTTVIAANGVQLNLTPYLGGPITIKDGVQLFGGRVAEPGKPFQPGARLFVTPDPNVFDQSHWPNPLFQIDGNNVRISGVRVEGPGPPPDEWRSGPQGTIGYTKGIRFVDKIGIEVDHDEFSGWNTAAVEAAGNGPDDQVWRTWTSKATGDSSGIHYPPGTEPVNIHDNYFHSNWYPTSPPPWSNCSQAHREACTPYFGYGVVVSGTHVLVERNAFNEYFHAIAANGCPGSGYRAYRNLVLRNGGGDGNQAFDAHHRRAECGQPTSAAGHDFDVRLNSFLYSEWSALYVNGTPDVGAFVSHNVFTNNHVKDDAVRVGTHAAWAKVWLDGTNLEGVKSWFDAGHLSTECDFDGDGFNDTFITTGETWWFQSRDHRNGAPPWVYLNTSPFLVENVRLGYFSADAVRKHVCDVAIIDGGYKGGTGDYGPLN